MKTLLLSLIIFFSFQSSAQTESSLASIVREIFEKGEMPEEIDLLKKNDWEGVCFDYKTGASESYALYTRAEPSLRLLILENKRRRWTPNPNLSFSDEFSYYFSLQAVTPPYRSENNKTLIFKRGHHQDIVTLIRKIEDPKIGNIFLSRITMLRDDDEVRSDCFFTDSASSVSVEHALKEAQYKLSNKKPKKKESGPSALF
jgi:hypothetical protein